MPFVSAFLPPSEQSATDLWFVFHGDRLLVKDTTVSHRIPRQSDLTHIKQALSGMHYLGTFDGFPCYAGEAEEHVIDPEGMIFQELRTLLGILGEDLFSVAARAFQILHWDRTPSLVIMINEIIAWFAQLGKNDYQIYLSSRSRGSPEELIVRINKDFDT